MNTIQVRGGVPLSGELTVSGSKNAALPILAASLLIRGPIELFGIPKISDVDRMLALLEARGSQIRQSGESIMLCAEGVPPVSETRKEESRLRGSLYLLSASLGAFGEGAVGLPGGCDLGARPFDLHLSVLRALGAETEVTDGEIRARAARLRGREYCFPIPSVGATVSGILAAVSAEGKTVLCGAAREPHVLDLISFLRSAGAKIETPKPGVIAIEGGKPLHSTSYRITSDMIEAGTYLLVAAATRGEILLRNAPCDQLDACLAALLRLGCRVDIPSADEIFLSMRRRPRPLSLTAEPYPGFPTDLHPQMAAVLSLAKGESRILETVFDRRFRYATELSRLGASLQNEGAVLNIKGVECLFGGEATAPDLRGGAALLIAALAAEGGTVLHGMTHLNRGYAALVPRLRSLGALISDGGESA